MEPDSRRSLTQPLLSSSLPPLHSRRSLPHYSLGSPCSLSYNICLLAFCLSGAPSLPLPTFPCGPRRCFSESQSNHANWLLEMFWCLLFGGKATQSKIWPQPSFPASCVAIPPSACGSLTGGVIQPLRLIFLLQGSRASSSTCYQLARCLIWEDFLASQGELNTLSFILPHISVTFHSLPYSLSCLPSQLTEGLRKKHLSIPSI